MVSELKARLSSYLAAVRRGETVLVRDRQTPIAQIIPYRRETGDFRLHKPSASPRSVRGIRPVQLEKPLDPLKLLREDRDSR